ncbi:hypothetical protein CWC14_10755 [Pseudoalteromonas sp. S3260]|jgi:hypothetical protein|uniref:hypothetical protein n=1 Tax=Pseudoalteromonas TaxID=53246 RepID=UPI00110A52E3|nr:hypothetical protein [Pseudoalteromonas sp. S3260]TMO96293.1 hypothetical protein CWC14_10755 [Pseudoalteromonas sp. S3260]
MLAPIIGLSLVASATFDSEQTIEQQTAFFKSQAIGQYARVMALKPSATSALEQACRYALTLVQRNNIKADLAIKLNVELPKKVSFIESTITNYSQQKQGEWLTCSGEVLVADNELNQAGLAIRAAWKISTDKDKTSLRPLLKVAMSHSTTISDAVALIADQSSKSEQLNYLDKYLVVSELQLEQAKEAVAKIWLDNQRYKPAIELLKNCQSVDCKRVYLAAKTKYEQVTADDLNSYF